MAVDITRSMDEILVQIRHLDKQSLNEQQLLFANHIEHTTVSLTKMIDGIPNTYPAHIQILPILGDSFLQSLIAVYGYAKLLLDSPASFNGATVNDSQRGYLETIFDIGQELQQYVESLQKQAFDYRLQARNQPQQSLDLIQLVNDNIDIYRYWIHGKAVQLQTMFTQEQLTVIAQPYHLNALIQHIITIIATELIEYGMIQLSVKEQDTAIELHIFCTGLQINNEHLSILFQKDGRHTYLKHLAKVGGKIVTDIQRGKGSSIIIRLQVE